MNITVYLGANDGLDEKLKSAAKELGAWIGKNGHTLIYGGSKSGLMGMLAISTMENGGGVIGVEPKIFIEAEFQLEGIDELIVTEDFTERKEKMIELGEAFIAFPGGTGTLEEISEVMSRVSLKFMKAPCIFYNIDGYYEGMKALLGKMTEKGLSNAERQEGIYFADTLEEIVDILEAV